MLVEDGYAHSLNALLEKSRAEERKLAGRRARRDQSVLGSGAGTFDWVVRLWTFSSGRLHPATTRRPEPIED